MNGGEGIFHYGMLVFVFMLMFALAIPEQASAIGCGGGLFGGAARRQQRRAERQSAAAAMGCSGGAAVSYVPVQQAPMKQAPACESKSCPAPARVSPTTKVEVLIPQASIEPEIHYVSARAHESLAWDVVPEYALPEPVIPHW